VESALAVDSEFDMASGLRVSITGLETADKLLSDTELVSEEDFRCEDSVR
jgi:hypothetical protein